LSLAMNTSPAPVINADNGIQSEVEISRRDTVRISRRDTVRINNGFVAN